ncbi:XkdX family protein [Ligilactobacillus apodemi]|nr:XkdX family protein [Ligilactobacillus apodemi]
MWDIAVMCYNAKLYSKDDVKVYVQAGFGTPEQYKELVGEQYEVAESNK